MTMATWPVGVVRPLVSACLRKETTDAHHIIGIVKPTQPRRGTAVASGTSQPERDLALNAPVRSGYSAAVRATRAGGLNRKRGGRKSGRTRRQFHCKSIPSAVSRMLVLIWDDPRHRSRHCVGRVRNGPRRDRDTFDTARFGPLIAPPYLNFCQESEFGGSRSVRTPNRLAAESITAISKLESPWTSHSEPGAAPDLGARRMSTFT